MGKSYTTDHIKLTGNIKGKACYLSLVFNYGYGVAGIGPDGKPKTTYPNLRMATGWDVRADQWVAPHTEDGRKVDGDFTQAFKQGRTTKAQWAKIEAAVSALKTKIITAHDKLTEELGCKPSPDQIMEAVRGAAQVVAKVRLADFVMEFANDVHRDSPLTHQKYATLANYIRVLEVVRDRAPFQDMALGSGLIHLGDFNAADWSDLALMITKAGCRVPKAKDAASLLFVGIDDCKPVYNQSSLEKTQQNLKAVLHYAEVKKRPLAVRIDSLKKVQRVETEKACLSIEQLDVLIKGKLERKEHDDARKVFTVMCLCGVAVSDIRGFLKAPIDMNRGRRINFKSITYTRSKTGIVATVPLTAPVLAILEADELPTVPKFDQQFNDDLKAACRTLGFDNVVNVIHTKADGTSDHQRLEFWKVVSSHLGRAVAKYTWEEILGIGRAECCQLMAHTLPDKGADQSYRRMTRIERAEKALLAASMAIEYEQLPFPFVVTFDRATLKRA